MMRKQIDQAGFTAVELLITLFIAASFLIAGYQLFDVVIRDGADTRAESRASNVAYDYLRRYSDAATSPCTNFTPAVTPPGTVEGLSNVSVSVIISCPRPDSPTLSKVESVVAYGGEGKSARIATFIDKSRGAAPNNPTTLNGLVAWWKFNGNGTSDVGSYPVTLTGTTFGNNRQDEANKAIVANGTSNSIASSTSNSLSPSSLTISMWVKPVAWNSSNATALITKRSAAAGTDGFIFGYLTSSNALFLDCGGVSQRWMPGYTPPLNSWTHLTITCTSGKVELFVNGVPRSNRTSNNTSAINSTGALTIADDSVSTNNYRLNGSLDDVRIYNRVLTNDEILQVAGESQ